MSKKIVNTDKAPEPVGPYNQSVQAGNIIFLSGQIPLNPQTGELVTDSVEAETHQVMKNLEAVLDANGCTFEDVVSCSVFVKDMEDYARVNDVYSTYFDEKTAPTRALVEVSRLPKDVRVEISAIAMKNSK